MKEQKINFEKINKFDMQIKYVEIDSKSPLNTYDDHIHDQCEIYINLSGDVSFSAENSIYPLTSGNIIITRPYEYHHCIYHSNKLHKHYWILFSASQNERLFDIFFKREAGKNNLLVLDSESTEELFEVCNILAEGKGTETEKYFYFFKLINLLNNSKPSNPKSKFQNNYITEAIEFINKNISENFSVKDVAKHCHISIATLERHFESFFNMSPTAYIKKKRLTNATKLLSRGCSVTEASYLSGFSDCSNFISVFKKEYKITPLQYQKKKK